jgi:hypothetical protein
MKIKLVLVSLALVSAVCAVGQPVGWNSPANPVTIPITLPPRWSLIANPLYHNRGSTVADAVPDNTVGEVFKVVPNGTQLMKFDHGTQEFLHRNVFHGGRWSDPQQTLAPGEGAFIFIPGRKPFTVTFTGNCAFGGSVFVPAGISLISSPDCGTINFAPLGPPPLARPGWDSLSFDPQEGDVVYSFDNAEQRFQIHTFSNGAWDTIPRIGAAESCFVQTTQPRTIRFTGIRPE